MPRWLKDIALPQPILRETVLDMHTVKRPANARDGVHPPVEWAAAAGASLNDKVAGVSR